MAEYRARDDESADHLDGCDGILPAKDRPTARPT